MALRGDLASVDLAQVFQMLALNKKVGLLSIHSAKQWKVLYFDQRGVTVHHNVHRVLDRVVAAFVRTHRLSQESVEEVRDHALRMGQPLAESLLAGGYVEQAELDDQYRIELEEEIYDLFFSREAKFEFHENVTSLEGRDARIDERFFFNCDSIIMEAARRIDEWAYISERVPTTAEVLVATAPTIDGEQFGPDGPAVFELLDGRRNIARIVEVTGLSNFQVCKVLSQLLDAGAVAPVAQEELLPLAAECMAEGRLQDAISLYERAVELGVGLPEAHAQAAKAYQVAEEYELAVYHLECEAEHRIGTGDHGGAARCLFAVKQLMPTDLQARDRLVELTLGQGGVKLPDFDPLAEGKELVELLIEFGDIERVRNLLERLLMVEPNDPDLKKALVNVHMRAGDQKRVVELYESIADDLVRQQKPLEAVAYLQKILLIDRSRTDVSERVRRLYEFDERSRRRSRALAALAGLFALLLLLGVAYWFYNDQAELAFARLEAGEMLARDDFAGAIELYTGFVTRHPLTTAVAKAEAELRKIEAAQQVYEARRAAERAARDKELARLREAYRSHWTRHREDFLAGRPEEALAAVGKVRELVAKAGAAADMAWALEQQVERTWNGLSDFVTQSQQLLHAYDERLAAGDWQGAREIGLRLVTDYEVSRGAKRVQLPVMVVTRPAGARLLQDGRPLTAGAGEREQPLVTPTLVLCDPARQVALTAELEGFRPRAIVIDGRASAKVDVVLEVFADRRVAFEAPVQTGVGVGDGWLAVGLRGGRMGIARTDGSARRVVELSGLKSAEQTPGIQSGRVFFVSNENTIECLPLEPGVRVGNWPVRLPEGFATELLVGGGRVAAVDGRGVLHCWEQATGQRAWGASLGSGPSGPPTIERRLVLIGTTDGRIHAFDATDGRSIATMRAPVGLSTRVLGDRGMLFFGCADGSLRAADFARGAIQWSFDLGRPPADRTIAVGNTRVIAAADGRLVSLDRDTGALRAEMPLAEDVRGVSIQGSRVFVQMRRGKAKKQAAVDALLAVDADTLAIAWEHVLDGIGPGALGCDEQVVAMPSTNGEVILFR